MAKQFKRITMANSNEVSLCSKYNSGANKQTEFEIVKDKEITKDSNMKQVIKNLIKFTDFYSNIEAEQQQEYDAFKDFLNYWMEYEVNGCYYNLLSEALQNAMCNIKYREDISKEEKILEYQKLFDMFIDEYRKMPITKNSDGKYEVSLVSKSPIQDIGANPQNETEDITKEKTDKMEKEQLNVIQKAFDVIKSALGLEKTETPSEETPEVQPEVETPAETEPEIQKQAEEAPVEETPVVNEEVVEEAPIEEEKIEETPAEEVAEEPAVETPTEEVVEEITEEIEKSTTDLIQQLAEMKKAKEEAEEKIEKMSFVQKAKDEFSMLVGTPEEIGEKLYSISKSNLETEVKDFIMDQLKKVSDKNSELTKELGSITKDSSDMTDEEKTYAKAEEIAKQKGISVNKALRQVK